MADLIIRRLRKDDYAGIQRIHRDCDDPWHDAAECAAWLDRRTERGFYIQAAELDGIVIGHGEWIGDDNRDPFYYEGMLQVDADYMRRGVGRAMIEDGARMARELGYNKIVTIPEEEEPVKAFYTSCGFVTGRTIKKAVLPVHNYGYSRGWRPSIGAPFDVTRDRNFIFGLAQVSSRHMWECNNMKPDSDDRITSAIITDNGDCIQPVWFDGNDTALALYWCDAPGDGCVKDILTFAHSTGLTRVSFLFFEQYARLFDGFGCEITTETTELIKTV